MQASFPESFITTKEISSFKFHRQLFSSTSKLWRHFPFPPHKFHPLSVDLERQSRTSRSNNSSLNTTTAKKRVAVWHTSQSTSKSSVALATKVVIARNSISIISAVQRLGESTGPDIGLDENLSTITGVDAISDVEEVRVIDVTCTEADGWCAGVDVGPVAAVVSLA